MQNKILVGGQAIIEGVMMRVPGAYATAVRKPDGSIDLQRHPFTSLTEKFTLLKKPLLRGIVSLYESLKIGLSTLQFSADLAVQTAATPETPPKGNRLATFLTTLVALVLGFVLFGVLPLWLTTRLMNIEKRALFFNLVTGCWRILFFLVYLWLIARLQDIRRLFQYHGAEHKVVFAFESGQELTIANVRPFSTHHPRCGTSFIFIILLVSILIYALIDTLFLLIFGWISLPVRVAFHLLLLPVVAAVGYECLKLAARHQEHPLARLLSRPGLWLQRLTTQPPSDEQLEVAILALKTAFGEQYAEFVGRHYVADAVS